jgi:hypothetical protein
MTIAQVSERSDASIRVVGLDDGAFYLPNGCPPWCLNDHDPIDDREDRVHYGEALCCPVGLEQFVRRTDGAWEEEVLKVNLWQHVESAVPTVQVSRGEKAPLFELRLDEAGCLADNLLRILKAAGE